MPARSQSQRPELLFGPAAAGDGAEDGPFLDRPGVPPTTKSDGAGAGSSTPSAASWSRQLLAAIFGIVAEAIAGKTTAEMTAIASADVPTEAVRRLPPAGAVDRLRRRPRVGQPAGRHPPLPGRPGRAVLPGRPGGDHRWRGRPDHHQHHLCPLPPRHPQLQRPVAEADRRLPRRRVRGAPLWIGLSYGLGSLLVKGKWALTDIRGWSWDAHLWTQKILALPGRVISSSPWR